jgi:hypothetical protein
MVARYGEESKGKASRSLRTYVILPSAILTMSTETRATGSFTDTKSRRRRQVISTGQCKGNSLQPQLEVLNGIRAHNQCFE